MSLVLFWVLLYLYWVVSFYFPHCYPNITEFRNFSLASLGGVLSSPAGALGPLCWTTPFLSPIAPNLSRVSLVQNTCQELEANQLK